MIVLDTHVWLWWMADPERLSSRAMQAIEGAEVIGVSTLSCWEIAMLHERGRIALDRSAGVWIRAALRSEERLGELRPDAALAVRAAELGRSGFHGDPADRFIYATTLRERASLVTRDGQLRAFDPERTVW